MESKAIARFARIAPRKARTVVNLVRGQKVAEAINMLLYTRKAAAPVVRKVIESALANARVLNPSVDVDGLYVSIGSVDKGPNSHLRRWRPRAMGRATQIAKGVSHIAITLTDRPPPPAAKKSKKTRSGEQAEATTETATQG
jgi:large subunit ribosomal protein L22